MLIISFFNSFIASADVLIEVMYGRVLFHILLCIVWLDPDHLFLLASVVFFVVLVFVVCSIVNSLHLSFCQLHKLECFSVLLSHIIAVLKAVEVELEVEHLLISVVVIEADDRDTVVELEGE